MRFTSFLLPEKDRSCQRYAPIRLNNPKIKQLNLSSAAESELESPRLRAYFASAYEQSSAMMAWAVYAAKIIASSDTIATTHNERRDTGRSEDGVFDNVLEGIIDDVLEVLSPPATVVVLELETCGPRG